MHIKGIKIRNFRSIKDTLIIDEIGDALVLTGENNSGKSTVINALAVFLGEKTISEKDFHKGTSEIEIMVTFSNITDEYLLKFAEYKKTIPQVRSLIASNALFLGFPERKIDKKEDLETPDQAIFIANEWLLKYKSDNAIINGNLSINLKIEFNNIKNLNYENKEKIEKIFPKVIFIDDERNFSNEQDGKTGSITEKIFKGIEIKNECDVDFAVLNSKIISGEKNISELNVYEIEALLKKQINNKSENIGIEITKHFSSFYDSGFRIDVVGNTDISHKTFSLKTQIYDPNLDENIDLNNVGAGLRALYLLSLLKAYNTFQKNENTIFIIEEPELYLHPGLQKKMAEILNDISKEQQLFFTTHSPLILRKFNLNDVKEIRKEANLSKIYNSTLNEILGKLGYSIFDIIDFDYIIFVEGISDISILEKIIEKFYPSINVKVLAAGNCTTLTFFAHFKFLEITRDLRDKFILIRDGDNHNVIDLKNSLRDKLSGKVSDVYRDEIINSKYKILARYSIENFFFNEELLLIAYPGYSRINFINRAEEYLLTERNGDALKDKQPDIYNAFRSNLETDFETNISKVRGHNIINCLRHYLYGENGHQNNKLNQELLINSYISVSEKHHFGELTEYLNELFGVTH